MTQEVVPYSTGDNAAAPAISQAQHVVLTQQTPKDAILTRKGKGGRTFSYVPHAWVTEMLNNAFGWAWSWEVVEWRLLPEVDPSEVFVLGRLTVHGTRDLTKTQFGSSAVKRDRSDNILSIGDDLKAASSDALKKCASLLGIALDLYRAEVRPSDSDGGIVSTDPMTAYWAAVKAKGMTKTEGQANLQKCGNDSNRALAALAGNNNIPPLPKKAKANDQVARPMKPETVKAAIAAKTKLYSGPNKLTAEDLRQTVINLSKLCSGKDSARYALTEYLTSDEDGENGIRSANDLAPATAWSIRQWAGAEKANDWQPNNHSVAETIAILAHLQGLEEQEFAHTDSGYTGEEEE